MINNTVRCDYKLLIVTIVSNYNNRNMWSIYPCGEVVMIDDVKVKSFEQH